MWRTARAGWLTVVWRTTVRVPVAAWPAEVEGEVEVEAAVGPALPCALAREGAAVRGTAMRGKAADGNESVGMAAAT